MRTFYFILCAVILNIAVVNAETITSIEGLNSVESGSDITYQGELTITAIADGTGLYCTDETGSVLLNLWYLNQSTKITLAKGDKIKVDGSVKYYNDGSNCRRIEYSNEPTNIVSKLSSNNPIATPVVVTLAQLLADTDKVYNATFVEVQNINITSEIDFTVSPFPVIMAVSGDDKVAIKYNLSDLPGEGTIQAFVIYEGGVVKLHIIDLSYVRAAKYTSISSLKANTVNVDGALLNVAVLVTSSWQEDGYNCYTVQHTEIFPSAITIKIAVEKEQYAIGDSLLLDVEGDFMPFTYTDNNSAINNYMTPATLTVKGGNISKVATGDVNVETMIVAHNADTWRNYDGRLIVSEKGTFFEIENLKSEGLMGFRQVNVYETGKYDTLLVATEYYESAGSPKESLVCGIIKNCGSNSYASLVPRSKEDFVLPYVQYNNVKEMMAAGTPISRQVQYEITGETQVTGTFIERGENITYVYFVQDATGAIQLNSSKKMNLEIGAGVKGIVGVFEKGGLSYAPAMSLKEIKEVVTSTIEIEPEEVTIDQLKSDVQYASKLVKLSEVSYEKAIYGPTETESNILYQGVDSLLAMGNFDYESTMLSVVGVYYLNSVKSAILPRSQSDIVVESVAVESVDMKTNVYVMNGIVYAENSEIVVYNITGNCVARGFDMVDISNMPKTIYLVKSIMNGKTDLVKVVNK